ncbi:MAG TPA: T9SS type A sorting domain-containing protein [Chitinophagaceae bacterium]
MKRILLATCIFLFCISNSLGQGSNCSNAITIPLDGNCNTYNTSSTTDNAVHCSGQGYGGNGRVTWFKFTTNSNADCVTMDMETFSNIKMEVALFTGCSAAAGTGLSNIHSVCMDDGDGIWATNLEYGSITGTNFTANTTYYLRIRTENGFTGSIQICAKSEAPSNNLCAGATGIEELSTPNQNNACNSGSTEVSPANLCAGTLENTAWYTFTVLTSGVSSIVISNMYCDNANVNTFIAGPSPDNYGFQIGFFTGSCGSLTPTNCVGQSGSAGGTVIASSTSLPAGTQVYVAIDGYYGSNCKYDILAINAAPLSVSMKSFEGWKGGDFNLLTWVTSRETNNQYFEIERSSDGNNYSTLGRVEGALNSSVEKRYSFKDHEPLYIGYYRLKQGNIHGNVTYSRVIKIFRPVTATLVAKFENPVYDILKANLQTSEAGAAGVQIVDVTGKIIRTESIQMQKGTNQYRLDLSKLTSGTYYLVMTKGDSRKTFPFIKY